MTKVLIGLTSGLFLAFTGFYLILNKNFRHHPYPMIGTACLFQAAYFFSYFDIFVVCKSNLIEYHAYNIGIWTSIKESGPYGVIEWLNYSSWMAANFTPEIKYLIFKQFIISWKVMVITFTYLHLGANSVIFIDLYLTLRNPFYPRKKRVWKYRIFLLMILIFALINMLKSIFTYQTSLNLYD